MFHDIFDKNDDMIFNRNKIKGLLNINDFKNKIEYLNKNYKIISINDYYNKNYNIEDFDNLRILTFDDGLLCHYKIVYPILKLYNIPAIFFITTYPILENKVITCHKIQFITNSNKIKEILLELKKLLSEENIKINWENNTLSNYFNNTWNSLEIFLTNILRKEENLWIVNILFNKYILNELNLTEEQFVKKFYMNKDNIIEIYNNGIEIGGHGHYHDNRDDKDSLIISKNFFINNKIKLNYYSYPNGIIYNNILKDLDIKISFTTENRETNKNDDLLLLPRINCCFIPNNNKQIILFGVQQQGLDICKYLINNDILISYVVTINKESSIINKASGWIDYSDFCKKFNIPLYHCKSYSLKSIEDFNFFKNNNFDIVLLGGWQRLIPENILNTLNYGVIGQHGSSEMLPRGRGRSPINWSIIENRKRIVWNIFYITPGIDDGNIIDNKIIDINEYDTCKTIYYKISIIMKQMYLENIPKILNNQVKISKQIGEPTYYKKRCYEDGLIDWEQSINEIYNLVRAVTKPYPGAFTYNGFSKINIWKVQPFDKNILYNSAKNGEVVEIFDNSFLVNCCDGTLLITEYDGLNIHIGDILSK
jgi:methionyl-tRNA formyltransferase/peptidoglycan/xylan/chitin deacetylase (PgdA/CDA1 family)